MTSVVHINTEGKQILLSDFNGVEVHVYASRYVLRVNPSWPFRPNARKHALME